MKKMIGMAMVLGSLLFGLAACEEVTSPTCAIGVYFDRYQFWDSDRAQILGALDKKGYRFDRSSEIKVNFAQGEVYGALGASIDCTVRVQVLKKLGDAGPASLLTVDGIKNTGLSLNPFCERADWLSAALEAVEKLPRCVIAPAP